MLNIMMANGLTSKQGIFVKKYTEGYSQKDSALIAGYSKDNVDVIASRMMRNIKIIKALDNVGITDSMIASNIKKHIKDGLGVKATADTSLRALDLATKLKGYQQQEPKEVTNNQTNIYVNELRGMDDTALQEKLDSLMVDIQSLK